MIQIDVDTKDQMLPRLEDIFAEFEDQNGVYRYRKNQLQADLNIGLRIHGKQGLLDFVLAHEEEMGFADAILAYTLNYLYQEQSLASFVVRILEAKNALPNHSN